MIKKEKDKYKNSPCAKCITRGCQFFDSGASMNVYCTKAEEYFRKLKESE